MTMTNISGPYRAGTPLLNSISAVTSCARTSRSAGGRLNSTTARAMLTDYLPTPATTESPTAQRGGSLPDCEVASQTKQRIASIGSAVLLGTALLLGGTPAADANTLFFNFADDGTNSNVTISGSLDLTGAPAPDNYNWFGSPQVRMGRVLTADTNHKKHTFFRHSDGRKQTREYSGWEVTVSGIETFGGTTNADINPPNYYSNIYFYIVNDADAASETLVVDRYKISNQIYEPTDSEIRFNGTLDSVLGDGDFHFEYTFSTNNNKVIFTTKPAKPSPKATPTDGQVTLNWADPKNSSITKYQYQQKTGSGTYGAWTDISPSGSSTTSHTFTGLTNGTEYTFKIRAVNPTGNSEESAEVSATPGFVPAKPEDLTATTSSGQVILSWSNPGNSSITKYQYQQKSGDEDYGDWTDIDPSGAATISHTITGLTNGTEYTFRIRAVNATGNSEASDEVPVAVGAPAAAELTATAGTLQAILSWTFVDDPSITKWQYQQREGDAGFGDEWKDIPGSGAVTRNYTVDQLTGDVTYTFHVRAVNANGDGISSNESQATPVNPGTPAAAELKASLEDGQVILSWTLAEDPYITKWQYQRREGEEAFGSGWEDIPGSGATTRSQTVTGPEAGVTHGFRVRALNVSGNGLASNEATVTQPAGGPSMEMERQVVTKTLAAVGQMTLAGVTDVIDDRLQSTPGTTTLMLGGQLVGATASSKDPAVDQDTGGWWSGNRSLQTKHRSIDDAGLIDGSAFTLSLSGEDAGESKSGWTIWGRGDYRSFEGKSGDDSWDGSVKSAWLGFDTWTNERMLAGLAVSRNQGEVDIVTEAVGSRVETSLTAAWPYVQMAMPNGNGTVRVILGVGSGDAEHHTNDGDTESAGLSMTAASVGVRWAVAQQGELELSVPVKAEVVQLKTDGDGTTTIGGLSVKTWRASGGMEAAHSGVALSDFGWLLTPRGTLKFRWDGGDSITGKGIEVGAGFGLHSPDSRLSLDASGHWLATHSDSNLREWGASVGVMIAPDSQGRGWSASLRQEWGLQQEGTLSDEALFESGTEGSAPALGSMAARAGYGFGVMEGLMTLSADAILATGDEEVPQYGAGLEFALPRGLTATLRGEHVDAIVPDTRIGASVHLSF